MIKICIGKEIVPYADVVANMRIEVFSEYPFFYKGDKKAEEEYFRRLTASSEAILILAYDDDEVIGISTGFPFSLAHKNMKQAFIKAERPVKEYFYFGESLVKKGHRGKGLGHIFMEKREEHVKKLGTYSHICFCRVLEKKEEAPKGYRPPFHFWKSVGYVYHPELTCKVPSGPTHKEMVFWLKEI